MAETVSLNTPITHPSVNVFSITQVTINVVAQSIYIQWVGDNNEAFSANYPTPSPNAQPTGAALIHTLNTANFGTNSLVKQIFTRLQADGYIGAGTISGTAS